MTMGSRLNYYRPLKSITIIKQALTAYHNLTFPQWQFQQQISQLSQMQNTSATLSTATGYYIYYLMAHVQNPESNTWMDKSNYFSSGGWLQSPVGSQGARIGLQCTCWRWKVPTPFPFPLQFPSIT